MKTLTSAVALLALTVSANAADLNGPLNINPVSPAVTAATTNWTGFYAGIHGGYTEGDLGFHPGTPGQHDMGAVGGGQLGYSYQLGKVVLGLEADVSGGDLHDKVHDGSAITQTSSIDAFGSVRARLGYAVGNLLPYVSGGLAWGGVTVGEQCPTGAQNGHCHVVGPYSVDTSNTEVGWTVGGGLEYAVSNNLSLRVEYLHIDLGSDTFNLGAVASPRAPEVTADMVRVGLNYRLASEVIPLK